MVIKSNIVEQGLIPREKVLERAQITTGQFAHLKNLGLIVGGIRRFEGRKNGVRAYYPQSVVETIRAIREKMEKGTPLLEQSLGRVERPKSAPARLDRHWLIVQFQTEPLLSRVRTNMIDAHFEALVASGSVRGELEPVEEEPERDLVELSTHVSAESIVTSMATRVGQAAKHGLLHMVGVIGLNRAKVTLAAHLQKLEVVQEPGAVDDNDNVKVALLHPKRCSRAKAALSLVERELRKAEGRSES